MKVCRKLSAAAVLLASWEATTAVAATLPNGFQETIVFQGLKRPTAVRFSPDGRIFVAEKSGVVKVFDSLSSTTPKIFADLRTEVDDYWDRGLLGLALHPNFPATPYVYVLYSYDAPAWGGPWNDNCPNPPGATTDGCVISGRLSRLTAAGDAMTGTEQVLLEAWGQQFPSHSVGDLHFGSDGALYVSGGDGASFNNVDYGQYGSPKNPLGDPPAGVGGVEAPPDAAGGALRSQSLLRASGGPALANGAILRVDAAGDPLPDNPLAGSADPIAQRMVALGLRNPFRFAVQPVSGTLWIGDVGWSTFEEIDRLPGPAAGPVANFGWPCYEGTAAQSGYQNANLDLCGALYAEPSGAAPPFYSYRHTSTVVPGESCLTGSSSISGLAFYPGGRYPAAYKGALFFGDYSRQCIWAMLPDAAGQPNPDNRVTFVAGASTPVDLQAGPGGDVFYADLSGGTVRRIQYRAPFAVATADPTSGPAPLTVQFDGSGSAPAEAGDTITYAWDFNGDGTFTDSTAVSPSKVYTQPGTYQARLRVTDNHGVAIVADPIPVTVGGVPPSVTIDAPSAALTWKVGDTIVLSGHAQATDSLDGDVPASALSWLVDLHHCPSNCHVHTVQTLEGVAGGSVAAPDHQYPSYLEVKLTAVTSRGVSNSTSVLLFPQTVTLTFQSSPSGVPLTVGTNEETTPFAQTVIVGSVLSVGAPALQAVGGMPYGFASWSDGGAVSHEIVAGSAPATFVATYTAADLTLQASANQSSVCPGGSVDYTLVVNNAGPSASTGVTVSIPLPSGASLAGASGDGWTCTASAVVGCSRDHADVGVAPPLRLRVNAPLAAGSLALSPSVSAATYDPDSSNNAAAVAVPVGCTPELVRITPTSGPASGNMPIAAEGDRFVAGATVVVGGVPASNVVVHGPTSLSADAPSLPAGTLNDVITTNPGGEAARLPRAYLSDFSDVTAAHAFHDSIEKIFRASITSGCGGGDYCPDTAVNRASMAVFLLRAEHGGAYRPPPPTGAVFDDVPLGTFLGDWIEQLAAEGITTGCGGRNFCPGAPVTRAAMAVFLLRAEHGAGYQPPPATGTVFGDVPLDAFLGRWIEELANEGLSAGCGGGNYCPNQATQRGEMAALLSRTFSLP
jgi:uncharacterized repeat protein (TIGR01451 family)